MKNIEMEDVREKLAYEAKKALEVQDACNSSGVVVSFANAMKHICDAARILGKGTDWRNQHPITRAYIIKLADLAGVDVPFNQAADCLDACDLISKGVQTQFGVTDHHTNEITLEPAN